jgi:phage baseplate assembly protein W
MPKEGISVKLPLAHDEIDGPYFLNKDLKSVVKQNLKNLMLTSPGERVMDADFGVGLKKLLFEPSHPVTYDKIKIRIRQQVKLYMPFLGLEDITISASGPQVQVSIYFNLGSLDEQDVLHITHIVN